MLVCMVLVTACQHIQHENPPLSRLHVGIDDPLYTTYTAAKERSDFTLDEGYHFNYYTKNQGINFTTDTGGEMGLVFAKGNKTVYNLSEMYRSPVITTSYPDMVRYHYYPFKNVRVNVSFLVQSSHTAVMDVTLLNEENKTQPIQVYPFIHGQRGVFDRPKLSRDGKSFYFSHHEYPDGWTRNHDLPHADTVYDAFAMTDDPTKSGIFNSFKGEAFLPPSKVSLNRKAQLQVTGRALTRDGERYHEQPPKARLQVWLNDSDDRILTEQSPIWGSAQNSINGEGFFRVELGNLGKVQKSDSYTLVYYSETDANSGRYTASISDFGNDHSHRRDITLQPVALPEVPKGLTIQIGSRRQQAILTWKGHSSHHFYNVYRRTYGEPYYEKIAEKIKDNSFKDNSLSSDKVYGYVVVSVDPHSGRMSMHSREITTVRKYEFQPFLKGYSSSSGNKRWAKVLSFSKKLILEPKQAYCFRLIRAVSDNEDIKSLQHQVNQVATDSFKSYLKYNESLFTQAPDLNFDNRDEKLLYWSAWNMMRQVFYPPEGKSSYNYYVFSREPTWGWGHGGQVFHESITMQAYAYLDPQSAMNSQRVFSERQYNNGYINYRTGSYLDEKIRYNGQLTSSAPWYSWNNWEVYKITGDEKFLKEMYASSKKFYNFYVSNRDSDGDGLCEWGGHAVLESVRDASVAVWDQVGWPANFEGVDVNSMLVKEAKSLEKMADALGLKKEAEHWKADYTRRSRLINKTMWDSSNGFYYNVDKTDNDFTFKSKNDLKRDEIIGFLPLWAGIASKKQAQRLLEKLTDPDQFWRKYGVPSLSAADPYYNDKGYWNGPVWVEWDYMIVEGLKKYGYDKKAKELVERISKNMIAQLKKNHNMWEFYSPDEQWAGYHKTYIWAGIINRMLIDVKENR